jgi:hypothetical protein
MALEQEMKPNEKATEKASRPRLTKSLAATADKVTDLAVELKKSALALDERDRNDEGRVRQILNAVTGGAIEHMLRGMNLDESDRNFLREKGWKV